MTVMCLATLILVYLKVSSKQLLDKSSCISRVRVRVYTSCLIVLRLTSVNCDISHSYLQNASGCFSAVVGPHAASHVTNYSE